MVMDQATLLAIAQNADFVALKRYSYSLSKAMERYPDGMPNALIAQALGIAEADVETIYQNIVAKLKVVLDPEDGRIRHLQVNFLNDAVLRIAAAGVEG